MSLLLLPALHGTAQQRSQWWTAPAHEHVLGLTFSTESSLWCCQHVVRFISPSHAVTCESEMAQDTHLSVDEMFARCAPCFNASSLEQWC